MDTRDSVDGTASRERTETWLYIVIPRSQRSLGPLLGQTEICGFNIEKKFRKMKLSYRFLLKIFQRRGKKGTLKKAKHI